MHPSKAQALSLYSFYQHCELAIVDDSRYKDEAAQYHSCYHYNAFASSIPQSSCLHTQSHNIVTYHQLDQF